MTTPSRYIGWILKAVRNEILLISFLSLLAYSCHQDKVVPAYPENLGLNHTFEYGYMDWSIDYEGLDSVSFTAMDTLTRVVGRTEGHLKVQWFTLFQDSYRLIKMINGRYYWSDHTFNTEVLFIKRNLTVGDSWETMVTRSDHRDSWENTYFYEVIDHLDVYSLNSINYRNVYVLAEGEPYTSTSYYWLAEGTGIIRAVIPMYVSGTYGPVWFERVESSEE